MNEGFRETNAPHDNSTKVILDGFETKHVAGSILIPSDELET